MDRVLYVAMSGARQTMQAQAANAHNLANASTTGFREDLLAVSAQELGGPGHASRVYSRLDGAGVNLEAGTQIHTGRPLDVAVAGSGWIAVQAPEGGEAYTRAGDLQITAAGMLVTGAGHPVLGESGAPIMLPPAERVDIASDGTISIRPLGQTPEALAVIDRIRLVDADPKTLFKGTDGLMRSESGPATPDAAVRLNVGVLEGSNVNTVDAMVNMISLSRQFEMQVKMMQTAEENDRASAQMMQIG
jgi:flagellar basal-body rod protein FlgF